MTIVVSDELRSLSEDEVVSSGTEQADVVVVVESGDGCRLLAGVGVGGMSIRDGGSIKLRADREMKV